MPDFTYCTSGCDSGNHPTYGECLRAKHIGLAGLPSMNSGWSGDQEKQWHKRIAEARAARRQGIRPDSTRLEDVRKAVEVSDRTGQAYVSRN